jgi:hypothetical protein
MTKGRFDRRLKLLLAHADPGQQASRVESSVPLPAGLTGSGEIVESVAVRTASLGAVDYRGVQKLDVSFAEMIGSMPSDKIGEVPRVVQRQGIGTVETL